MLKTIVRIIAGFYTAISGFLLLINPNCNTLSFDSEAGGRAIRPICSFDSSGAIPGWLGGIIVLVLGIVILPWQKLAKLFENLDSAVNGFNQKEATFKSVRNTLDDIPGSELKTLPKPMLGSGYPKGKGWNSDPSERFYERYWDGENWTSQTRDRDWKKQAKSMKISVVKKGSQQVIPPSSFAKTTESSTEVSQISSSQNLAAELATLSNLFSMGHLSEEEFKSAKKKMLG